MARSKLLRNGRSDKKGSAFSSVSAEMQRSAAFQSLSASALRVLLWSIFKNYKSATAEERAAKRPTFMLTNNEAQLELGMNQQTFSRAKKELALKGFIEWTLRGGLKGCNGVASKFALSGVWKTWTPPQKEKSRRPTPPGKTLKSVKAA